MSFENQLVANFSCVKCRGKSAVTKTLSLNRGLTELLTLSSGKYVLLSCALCGYTEIYSPLAHATSKEASPATEGSKSLASET
jgi:predicted nucleic-acid-binding Zn-ribbon protein